MTRVTETFGVDSSWPTSRATPTVAVSSSSLCASTGSYGWKSASTQTQPLPFHVQTSALHRANKSLAKVGFRVKQRGARPLMSLACVRCFQLFTYRRSPMRFYCQHQNSALIFTNAGGRAPVRPLVHVNADRETAVLPGWSAQRSWHFFQNGNYKLSMQKERRA